MMFSVLQQLNSGRVRVCVQRNGKWFVQEEIKADVVEILSKASCRVFPGEAFDKIPSKFENWSEQDFQRARLRVSPGAFVRFGTFLDQGVVLMSGCFVNLGVFIGSQTMVDSLVTVGSCAQIGNRCHLGAGTTIGGVLEPVSARPVILEDDCFVGANCVVAEGVLVRQGATLAAGTVLTASTWIVDRATGRQWKGEIPSQAVVIPGAYADEKGACPGLSIQCAVIDHYKTEASSVVNAKLR